MPAVFLVFLGGMLGGAVRIGLDAAIPSAGAVPLDLVVINVVGSAALGAVTGWSMVEGRAWWLPLVGPGLLGGFTTFSSIAALAWSAEAGLAVGAGVLAGTMAASVFAAAVGWRWAVRRADAREATR
ncbi:fluoride efflux transporter FluC [Demequina globuliformis]|uniref:fluoride efflux transporter FluC n=1 Tax=Demequina globuliformis TaxID=676202 RepID=UPI000784AC87|nr:CrcB family protein [Demequina globuliformis]